MNDRAKFQVEAAVNNIVSEIGAICQIFCEEPSISTAKFNKIRGFLHDRLDQALDRIVEARAVKRVSGGFSLDDDDPPFNTALKPGPVIRIDRPDPRAVVSNAPKMNPVNELRDANGEVVTVTIPENEPPEIAARRKRMEELKRNGGRLSGYAPEVAPDEPRAPVYPNRNTEHVDAGIGFLDDEK